MRSGYRPRAFAGARAMRGLRHPGARAPSSHSQRCASGLFTSRVSRRIEEVSIRAYAKLGLFLTPLLASAACTTLPSPKVDRYAFPKKQAFLGDVKRPYTVLGQVRSKAEYPTLSPEHDEDQLCRNYFNKAVKDLVKRAKEQGADAVIDVRAVTILEDGRFETYPRPECADDGEEGQVLVQGLAVKWKSFEPGFEPIATTEPKAVSPSVAETPAPKPVAEIPPRVPSKKQRRSVPVEPTEPQNTDEMDEMPLRSQQSGLEREAEPLPQSPLYSPLKRR